MKLKEAQTNKILKLNTNMIQIYKPNSKNTGSAFTFSKSLDQRSNAPVFYISAIAQHGWNENTKTGSFAGNSKNPEKTINMKINETEAGEFISAFNHRYEHTAFHAYDGNTSTIKVTPWDKSVKISKYDPATKGFSDSNITVPAFGFTLSKGKGNTIKIALDPGEVENVKILLTSFISESLEFKSNLNISNRKNDSRSNSVDQNSEVEDFEQAPF